MLRKVLYRYSNYDPFSIPGVFHTWGQRGDNEQMDFFGVVEIEDGQCIELDASRIKFIDPAGNPEQSIHTGCSCLPASEPANP